MKKENVRLKINSGRSISYCPYRVKEFSTEEDATKQRLVYSTLNNMLGHWDEIRDTMGIFTEES